MLYIIKPHLWEQIKHSCSDYIGSIVTSNYLQEVNVMNSHLFEIFSSEKSVDILHSVELFAGIIAAAFVVGLACIAVV